MADAAEMTSEELEALCGDLGLSDEDLDDEVHDAKAAEAADINNGGFSDQIAYLISVGYIRSRLEEVIREIAAEKAAGYDDDEDEDIDADA